MARNITITEMSAELARIGIVVHSAYNAGSQVFYLTGCDEMFSSKEMAIKIGFETKFPQKCESNKIKFDDAIGQGWKAREAIINNKGLCIVGMSKKEEAGFNLVHRPDKSHEYGSSRGKFISLKLAIQHAEKLEKFPFVYTDLDKRINRLSDKGYTIEPDFLSADIDSFLVYDRNDVPLNNDCAKGTCILGPFPGREEAIEEAENYLRKKGRTKSDAERRVDEILAPEHREPTLSKFFKEEKAKFLDLGFKYRLLQKDNYRITSYPGGKSEFQWSQPFRTEEELLKFIRINLPNDFERRLLERRMLLMEYGYEIRKSISFPERYEVLEVLAQDMYSVAQGLYDSLYSAIVFAESLYDRDNRNRNKPKTVTEDKDKLLSHIKKLEEVNKKLPIFKQDHDLSKVYAYPDDGDEDYYPIGNGNNLDFSLGLHDLSLHDGFGLGLPKIHPPLSQCNPIRTKKVDDWNLKHKARYDQIQKFGFEITRDSAFSLIKPYTLLWTENGKAKKAFFMVMDDAIKEAEEICGLTQGKDVINVEADFNADSVRRSFEYVSEKIIERVLRQSEQSDWKDIAEITENIRFFRDGRSQTIPPCWAKHKEQVEKELERIAKEADFLQSEAEIEAAPVTAETEKPKDSEEEYHAFIIVEGVVAMRKDEFDSFPAHYGKLPVPKKILGKRLVTKRGNVHYASTIDSISTINQPKWQKVEIIAETFPPLRANHNKTTREILEEERPDPVG